MNPFCYKELFHGGVAVVFKREKCRSGTSFARLRYRNVEADRIQGFTGANELCVRELRITSAWRVV
jgi:hypothetical protein